MDNLLVIEIKGPSILGHSPCEWILSGPTYKLVEGLDLVVTVIYIQSSLCHLAHTLFNS